MRILIVHVHYRNRGGEDVVVDAEATLLRDAGHDVRVYETTNPDGTDAARTVLRSSWNTASARRVQAELRMFRPDVVHVHNTWFTLSVSILAVIRTSGIPLVMTLHNYRAMCVDASLLRDGKVCRDCVGTTPIRGVLHGCYRDSRGQSAIAAVALTTARLRRIWEAVDVFIAPSEHLKAIHVEHGFAQASIVVKPHFVEPSSLRAAPPGASNTLVFAGRLAPGKGILAMLGAWNAAALNEMTLHVFGDGPLREVAELEAAPDVVFHGHQTLAITRAAISTARALVFPSEWLEPFGVVLIEAMAAGTPIVGFDTADTASIVGDAGELVTTSDVTALANALRALTPERADRLGTHARSRHTELFSPPRNLVELEAIYALAIKRCAARPNESSPRVE